MKAKVTYLLLAVLICSLTPTSAWAEKVKRKGRFLHTEIIGFEDKTSFRATLSIQKNSSFPVIKIHRLTRRNIREAKVFETVLDTMNAKPGTNYVKDYRNLTVVPGELTKDAPTTRVDIIEEGPFKNTTFFMNGIPMTTDSKGLVADSYQQILSKFDDLTQNSATVTLSHPEFGTQNVTFTRFLIRPRETIMPDYKKHDAHATLDILEAMGIDTSIPVNPATNKLRVTYKLPSRIKPGTIVPLIVNVTNQGGGVAGNLFLSTFSRENWLDGKLFYFGNLAPGKTQSFLRLLRVPDHLRPGTSYALLASWDTVRPQPKQALLITLQH